MDRPIRLAVIDDHPLLREGLVAVLSHERDMQVVGEGGSLDDALRILREQLPDLVLLDLDMPGQPIGALAQLAQASPGTRLVILTASESEEHVVAAFRSGAAGYVLKGVMGPELVRIVRSVVAGNGYAPPSLAAALIGAMTAPAPPPAERSSAERLTARERDIINGVAEGWSNREIADRLFLSEKTVKYYITNILHKLQLRNRVELALLVKQLEGAGKWDRTTKR